MTMTVCKRLLMAVSLCLFVAFSHAKSFIWQVTKGAESFYLGGTIHVLNDDDLPLPKAFDESYKKSQALILEVDFEEMQAPEFQRQSLEKMFYPFGESIVNKLDKKTEKKLRAYAKANDVNLSQIQRMRAGFLSVMITLNELAQLNDLQDGVDQRYFHLAKRDRKPVIGLESADEQLSMLSHLGEGYESEFIEQALADTKNVSAVMRGMKKAWREGDVRAFERTVIKPMRKNFPKVYNDLFVKRNQRWMPTLLDALNPELNELVLVGAGHLIGKEGLLAMLEKQGFTLTQL